MTLKLGSTTDAVNAALENLPEESSRRLLLTLGGVAALSLLSSKAEAQTRPPGYEVWVNWKSPTNRLIRRISNGIDTTEQAIAASLGFKGYLEKQLNYSTIVDSDADRIIASRWPKMAWTEAQLYDDQDQYDQFLQLVYSTIFRQTYSRKLLYERMVEFWTDHFNVHIDKVGSALMTTYIQKNIRRHAMGKFGDLLKSTAHSAAMLHYLDNDDNTADAPNINYSRELHELHTVGVDGGYTANDLHQAALILSGWTWSWWGGSYNRGRFKFEIDYHAGGSKKVMGQTYPESGQQEGEALLDYLSTHPNTAKFVTKKMCKWLLGDSFSQTVWTQAQQTFISSGGDIKSVLRVILTEANLMASVPKYKRPAHLLVSALRSCKSRIYQYGSILYGPLSESGQVPFDWSPPDGYPDRFDFWAASQMPRLNIAFRLGGNFIGDVTTDVTQFRADRTPQGCLTAINKALFGGEMSTADASALLQYLSASAITDDRLRGAIVLAVGCPSFQWY